MPAKFEWYIDSYGKYRFTMKAGNGQVIARSDPYESKERCMHGIESSRKNERDAETGEVKGS